MSFYIAQAVGLVITGLALAVQHFKKMQVIVVIEFLMNVLTAVQYYLLGSISGAYVSIAATVHTAALVLYDKFGNQESRKVPSVICALFAAIYVAIGVCSFGSWYDIFPVVATVLFSLSVVQTKSSNYRIIRIINAVVWIVYCLCSRAYSLILAHALGIVSGITAIIRLDIKKEKVNES